MKMLKLLAMMVVALSPFSVASTMQAGFSTKIQSATYLALLGSCAYLAKKIGDGIRDGALKSEDLIHENYAKHKSKGYFFGSDPILENSKRHMIKDLQATKESTAGYALALLVMGSVVALEHTIGMHKPLLTGLSQLKSYLIF